MSADEVLSQPPKLPEEQRQRYLAGDRMLAIVVAVVALVVLVLVFALTRFVEFIADLVGKILGLRPVLFILGLLGMIEAGLLFMDSSLMTLTGM